MARGSKTVGVVMMVVVVGVAWYLYTPLPQPPDLDQRYMVRNMAFATKLMRPVLWVMSWLPAYKACPLLPFRAIFNAAQRPKPLDADPELQVTDEIFDGVLVRVYRPKSAAAPLSVVMHYHGGGWSVGSYVSEDHISRYLAKAAQVAVVSVDYRLAPEHPFPAGLEDCVRATRHVMTHAHTLGFNPQAVGTFGISAGGNLATTVSLRLQDPEFKSLPRLAYQVVMMPCLQGLDFGLPSYITPSDVKEIALRRETMVMMYLAYAGLPTTPENVQQLCNGQHIRAKTREQWAQHVHPDLLTDIKILSTNSQADAATEKSINNGDGGGDGGGGGSSGRGGAGDLSVNERLASLAEPVLTNPLLSPVLAPDTLLKHGPPALVVVSQHDVLRDDGLLYVRRLRHAGADVSAHLIENGHHVSMVIFGDAPGSPVTAEIYRRVVAFISEHSAKGLN